VGAVEQRRPVPEQDGNKVQLHLINQVLGQALPGNVGASSDGDVAVARRLSGELDCGWHTIGWLTSDGLEY
jgi:hypothetical protein